VLHAGGPVSANVLDALLDANKNVVPLLVNSCRRQGGTLRVWKELGTRDRNNRGICNIGGSRWTLSVRQNLEY
jgi:hypothetical protein